MLTPQLVVLYVYVPYRLRLQEGCDEVAKQLSLLGIPAQLLRAIMSVVCERRTDEVQNHIKALGDAVELDDPDVVALVAQLAHGEVDAVQDISSNR